MDYDSEGTEGMKFPSAVVDAVAQVARFILYREGLLGSSIILVAGITIDHSSVSHWMMCYDVAIVSRLTISSDHSRFLRSATGYARTPSRLPLFICVSLRYCRADSLVQ